MVAEQRYKQRAKHRLWPTRLPSSSVTLINHNPPKFRGQTPSHHASPRRPSHSYDTQQRNVAYWRPPGPAMAAATCRGLQLTEFTMFRSWHAYRHCGGHEQSTSDSSGIYIPHYAPHGAGILSFAARQKNDAIHSLCVRGIGASPQHSDSRILRDAYVSSIRRHRYRRTPASVP